MELPKPIVGNDYFSGTKKIKKDKTHSQAILQALLQKNDKCLKTIKSVASLTKQRSEMADSVDQEIKLAEELAKHKRKQFLDEKRRQLLRENNHELRELESKLRAAYVAKCLKSQMAEKEVLRQEEAALQKQENELLEKALHKEDEFIRLELEDQAKRKEILKKDLQDQIANVRKERSKRYEEFLREKKMFDEIAHKIQEELLEEMRIELEKKVRYKSDIDEFVRIQKAWREQQKKDLVKEDEHIRKYLEEKEMFYKEINEKKQKDIALRQDISYKIGQETSKIMTEKIERERIMFNLYAAEKEAIEEEKIRKQIEKEFRKRIQLRTELDKHKEEILLRKQAEEADDRAHYEEQMRILAERDKIEQLSNEKRRKKILEHRRELQKCLEENKIKKAEEIAALLKQREEEIQEEKTRQQVIEEERINLLKEHITNVFGYLPPGILRESDREFLPLPNKN